MNKCDSDKIVMLARECKLISRIQHEDFPQYSYDDIYAEVYEADERSILGTMRMITMRVNKLKKQSTTTKQGTLDEINELADYLYRGFKENHKKLEKIRKTLA